MTLADSIADLAYSIAEMLTLGYFKSPLTRQAEKPIRKPKTYAQIRRDYDRRREAYWREWHRRMGFTVDGDGCDE